MLAQFYCCNNNNGIMEETINIMASFVSEHLVKDLLLLLFIRPIIFSCCFSFFVDFQRVQNDIFLPS